VPLAGVAGLTDLGNPAARDSQLGVTAALAKRQQVLRYDSGDASGNI
jgi:hypothetical protein